MRILVTGATSGLGRNAVDFLLAAGMDVVATGRNPVAGQQLAQTGARFVAMDLTLADESAIKALMAGCDAVWHCAAKSSPWGKAEDFFQANVTVTQKLVNTATHLSIPRFVHISTPAIYFDFQHHHALPETYLARRFACHYARTKYLAEQVVAQAVPQNPATTFVILRPRGLFGPHDNVIVPRVLRQLHQRRGVLHLPRGGRALLDLTYVENVVHAMWLATSASLAQSGECFNITNQQPSTLADMLYALLNQQLGLHYRIKSVPWPLVSLVASGMEIAGTWRNQEPALTRYSAGTASFDMTLSNEKAQRILGYQPRFSMDAGIARTGEWWLAHGNNNRI